MDAFLGPISDGGTCRSLFADSCACWILAPAVSGPPTSTPALASITVLILLARVVLAADSIITSFPPILVSPVLSARILICLLLEALTDSVPSREMFLPAIMILPSACRVMALSPHLMEMV